MYRREMYRNENAAIDLLNAVAGLLLVFSPWLFGFYLNTAAALSAWMSGLVIAGIAIGALVALGRWQHWGALMLGLWTAAAPWLLGFAHINAAFGVHLVAGLVVAAAAAFELWAANNDRPFSAA